MVCDADDLLHHGCRHLHSIHIIRLFNRLNSSAMDLLPMAGRHSAVLLRIDAMAQNSLHPVFQALAIIQENVYVCSV